jgi:peptide/nickel transport system substrate-binding protein
MFDSRLAGGTLDYAGYHTPRLDSLFLAVDRAVSEDSLAAAWGDVQRELERAMPVAWVYHARGVQGLSARLAGVEMDLRGELPTLIRWRIGPTGDAPREGS